MHGSFMGGTLSDLEQRRFARILVIKVSMTNLFFRPGTTLICKDFSNKGFNDKLILFLM